MENGVQLSLRFKEVYLNGKWIVHTNYKEILQDVTWEQATKKIGSLNTIAALTFHVNYYMEGVLHLFESGRLEISDKYSFDMKEVRSQEDWDHLYNEFVTNAEKFATALEEMSDEKLAETFATSVDLIKSESAAVYRVRLGPYLDRDEAIGLRDKAKENNYPKAFIITTQRELEQK